MTPGLPHTPQSREAGPIRVWKDLQPLARAIALAFSKAHNRPVSVGTPSRVARALAQP
jgi:hypothetical protein